MHPDLDRPHHRIKVNNMEIHLTSDIEQALREQAERQGTTPEQLALESLRRQFVNATQNERSVEEPDLSEPPALKSRARDASKGKANRATKAQGTLADYLAGFIGALHSSEHVPGGARMSLSTRETFGKVLVEKRKQGRL